jgi:hypothetical protein
MSGGFGAALVTAARVVFVFPSMALPKSRRASLFSRGGSAATRSRGYMFGRAAGRRLAHWARFNVCRNRFGSEARRLKL